MNFLLGIIFFTVLSLFCAVCLRRYAQETDLSLLCLASVGLSNVLLVLGGALLLPWLAPLPAMTCLFLLCATGLLLLGRGSSWKPLEPRRDSLWLTVACLPGALLTAFFALFIMSWSFGVDDGFFLHSSNIGMIIAGKYPPTSFLGEPWQGHYGKDLLSALLALVFGVSFLEVEWFSTVALQVLHFLFLVHWLRVESGKVSYALLGGHFAFFASAFSEHLGLVDTITNNNAVAYITLSLCSYLLLRWYRTGLVGAAVMAGIFLGVDALIYEIHFGLMGLALFTITVLRKDRYKGFLILVAAALFLASVEGGPITQIASKAVFGKAEHQKDSKKAWQSQDVEIQIPKKNLFYLRRDNLRPSRFFETKLRPVSVDFTHSREPAPLWSAPILSVFWYPVWLAPLVFLGLLKQRNLLAGWFFAIGFYSLLTPCLVGFGYFEGETTRWLFGTAFGFSTAFALVLAQALHHSNEKLRYIAYAILAWSIWFNLPGVTLEMGEMAHTLRHVGEPQVNGNPGLVVGSGLIPHTHLNLAHHHGFDQNSFALTKALRERSDGMGGFLRWRYIVNYPDERVPQGIEVAAGGVLNIMGFQTGLSGRLPAGLASAPDNRWSSPLFSQNLSSRLFWYDPQLWRLHQLDARWLLVDDSRLTPEERRQLTLLPDLEELARSGNLILWQIPEWSEDPPGEWASLTRMEAKSPQGPVQARRGFSLETELESAEGGLTQLEFRYLVKSEQLVANPDDLLRNRVSIRPGIKQKISLPLVGPYFPGEYEIQWRESGTEEWARLVDISVEDQMVEGTGPSE